MSRPTTPAEVAAALPRLTDEQVGKVVDALLSVERQGGQPVETVEAEADR